MSSARPSLGLLIYWSACLLLGATFVFAAMQGNYGLFRRAEVRAEAANMRVELAILEARMAQMENQTRRMSDDFLDLDLLDEQARSVLGLLRVDEIVIR
jgi:cell division protein FtsB